MKVGTKSVLFGAHCFFIHPLFVAAAWRKLYGFPKDWRLWLAFFVHDLGYVGKPNMDGPEGESHVELGAAIVHRCFDRQVFELSSEEGNNPDEVAVLCRSGWKFGSFESTCGRFKATVKAAHWRDFALYHSRSYAKRDGVPYSKLCVADKLAVALEPWWLYLPRVIATGEIKEYMKIRDGEGSKYRGEPKITQEAELAGLSPRRAWHRRMTNYCRAWAYEHRDGQQDTWTPEPIKAAA